MLSVIERVFLSGDFLAIRKAWISRAKIESERTTNIKIWMVENGFEIVDVKDGAVLTPDGREVLRAHKKAWALTVEEHRRRQEASSIATKNRKPQSQKQYCAALVDGQLCGGSLIIASVCPKCSLGKQGVVATLTCDVCGHVTAIMRGPNNG